MVNIGNDWDQILDGEFEKEYYLKLREFLKKEYASGVIYPSMYDIFNSLKATPYDKDVYKRQGGCGGKDQVRRVYLLSAS